MAFLMAMPLLIGALAVMFLIAISLKVARRQAGVLDRFIYGSGTFLLGLAMVALGIGALNSILAG